MSFFYQLELALTQTGKLAAMDITAPDQIIIYSKLPSDGNAHEQQSIS